VVAKADREAVQSKAPSMTAFLGAAKPQEDATP